MARDVPGSVANSVRVLGLIVATSGVITLLIWLMRDDVILGWAEGNPSAQTILDEGGIELLRDSPSVPGPPWQGLRCSRSGGLPSQCTAGRAPRGARAVTPPWFGGGLQLRPSTLRLLEPGAGP